MHYMIVYTYEPEKRDAVIKRRVEKGSMVPKGMTVLGEWSDLAGGRIFKLVEVSEPVIALSAASAWNDLGKTEIVPVIDTDVVFRHHASTV
jgi:hypothetical protein